MTHKRRWTYLIDHRLGDVGVVGTTGASSHSIRTNAYAPKIQSVSRPRTCPSRPQHWRANSRAAASQCSGAMRSAYGDAAGRRTQHRHPMRRRMSASALAWKRVKCARAYASAATAPVHDPSGRLSAWYNKQGWIKRSQQIRQALSNT